MVESLQSCFVEVHLTGGSAFREDEMSKEFLLDCEGGVFNLWMNLGAVVEYDVVR